MLKNLTVFLRYKYYNKQIPIRDDGNNWFHDSQKSKFSSTINVKSGAHTLTDVKIIKSPFNKNNTVIIKNK